MLYNVKREQHPVSLTRCISGFFPRIYRWLLLQTRTQGCSNSATQSSLAQSESTEIYYVSSPGCCFFFLCIANINFEWCSLFCQVDIRLFLRSVVPYHLCDATTPPWVDRSLRLLAGEAFPVVGTRSWTRKYITCLVKK